MTSLIRSYTEPIKYITNFHIPYVKHSL
jgi:hypothetical protein